MVRVKGRIEANEVHFILYVKNVCERFQESSKHCREEHIKFSAERKDRISVVISANITTTFFNKSCRRVRKTVTELFCSRLVWDQREKENRESFMRFIQIFSSETVATLQGSTLTTYPSYDFILYISLRKRQWIIDNGHTIVGFLPLFHSDDEVKKEESSGKDDISVYRCTSPTPIELGKG